jgi:hypothetical protein
MFKVAAVRSQAGFPTIEQLGLFKLEAWGAPIWIYQALPIAWDLAGFWLNPPTSDRLLGTKPLYMQPAVVLCSCLMKHRT